ncbi:MAG: hypothetical protein MZV64_63150 [Ignavibacteriales bacterium]|nr:hypothetical protein [Ignavibacteriales bacterium]
MSNVDGSIKVFAVDPDGTVEPSHTIPLPPAGAPRRERGDPGRAGPLAPTAARLYVCGNLSNRLLEIDAGDGRSPADLRCRRRALRRRPRRRQGLRQQLGRAPARSPATSPARPDSGTEVRVDPVRHIASEGSVSVIDLGRRAASKAEILVRPPRLGPGRLARTAATSSAPTPRRDNLSVIDTRDRHGRRDDLGQGRARPTSSAPRPTPWPSRPTARRSTSPTAPRTPSPWSSSDPARRKSRLKGLIPVGWFPGALAFDARRDRRSASPTSRGTPSSQRRTSRPARPGSTPTSTTVRSRSCRCRRQRELCGH